MMTQTTFPFQYNSPKTPIELTSFAGLPLYIDLAKQSGLYEAIASKLTLKLRGWRDVDLIMSLILLNLAGGDCISDIERLEKDAGLNKLLLVLATHGMKPKEKRAFEKRWRKEKSRAFPSNAAFHRYLPRFHSADEELKREPGKAFIPEANDAMKALMSVNQVLIEAMAKQVSTQQATLDQDATLVESEKRNALFSYKKMKGFQPFNTYWAEQGSILHSEFRDGNVPAGFEQLRLLKESIALLPSSVTQVFLRSDTAGYQEALLRYCAEGKDERLGVIEFAVGANVSAGFRAAALEVKAEEWQPLYKLDAEGNSIKTSQEWAEVCFIPDWAIKSNSDVTYRYLAIREVMRPLKKNQTTSDLSFQTMESEGKLYKLFAVVTNRDLEGNALIQWYHERCGKSEQVHSTQKEALAGGQLPSNLFGVNAAWWQIMILSFNLNRLMQLAAVPVALKEKKMKALRFHIIQLPGRLIKHARRLSLQVEKEVYELYEGIRKKITEITPVSLVLMNTS